MTLLEMIIQKNEGLVFVGSRDLIGELVADIGQDFTPKPRPDHLPQGEAKNCFQNATDLSLDSEDNLRYVEGLACSEDIPFPIHHAWVIDENDKVIDPTWNNPENCLYRGIVIERDLLVERMMDSGVYGAFDNGVRIDHDWLIDKLEWQPEWLLERVRPNVTAMPKP